MKRFALFVLMAFVLSTVAATANPFSDVPFSHWAYDAVNKLAAKGLLQGYPDGTYKGEKHVTRYALAMVIAKMLANVVLQEFSITHPRLEISPDGMPPLDRTKCSNACGKFS